MTATNAAGNATATSAAVGPVTVPPPPPNGLHVSGNQLLNASGNPIQLHGVDRSGTEYACIQGWGIFDGPNVTDDDSQIPLMKAWNANELLIGLNEDYWLGINDVPAAYGSQNYINAIVHETKTAEADGLYPVISRVGARLGRGDRRSRRSCCRSGSESVSRRGAWARGCRIFVEAAVSLAAV